MSMYPKNMFFTSESVTEGHPVTERFQSAEPGRRHAFTRSHIVFSTRGNRMSGAVRERRSRIPTNTDFLFLIERRDN